MYENGESIWHLCGWPDNVQTRLLYHPKSGTRGGSNKEDDSGWAAQQVQLYILQTVPVVVVSSKYASLVADGCSVSGEAWTAHGMRTGDFLSAMELPAGH